jgi:hypothetical protein
MIRERVRGASCAGSLLRDLAQGIEQGELRVGDEKFHVAANVVAVADADPATGELLIVVTGCAPLPSDPGAGDEPQYEPACSGL